MSHVVKKRRMVSDADAENFRAGRPIASGKKKKREREHDADLLDAHTKKVRTREADSGGFDVHLPATEIKAVMDETVWRVMHEVSPETANDEITRINSDEIAYILLLAMVTGMPDHKPRRGMKIKTQSMDLPPLCSEHA